MSSNAKHTDLEYHVVILGSKEKTLFYTWKEAREHLGENAGKIDVCVWSKKGAEFYGGADSIEQYLKNPYAKVFDRFVKEQGEFTMRWVDPDKTE